jgi:hypothetical protein
MFAEFPIRVTANIVIWIYQSKYGLINFDGNADGIISEVQGIVEQLMAEETGLA